MGDQRLNADEVRRLYDRHGAALVAYACTLVPNAAAAEDVVHGVFVKLLSGAPLRATTPAAYLYRAVRNQALNATRNGRHETQWNGTEAWFTHPSGSREGVLALQHVLVELPGEQREVVVMRIWAGMTFEEISAATGVSVNTAASRYRYALDKLRERLQPLPTRIETGEHDG